MRAEEPVVSLNKVHVCVASFNHYVLGKKTKRFRLMNSTSIINHIDRFVLPSLPVAQRPL